MIKKILKNKFLLIFILLLIIIFGWKIFFKKKETVQYQLTEVKKGEIVLTVSGSGQIETLDKVELSPKISGELESIFVKKDQKVKKGDLLFKLKTSSAQDNIEDLKIALNNNIFTLEKLEKLKSQTKDDLKKAFKDGFILISNVYEDLSTMMEVLKTMAQESSYGSERKDLDYYHKVVGLSLGQYYSENEIKNNFERIKEIYDQRKKEYLSLSQFSSQEELKNFFEKIYDFLIELSEFTRKNRDTILLYLQYLDQEAVIPPIPLTTTQSQLSNLKNYTDSLNQYKTSLLLTLQSIDRYQTSIENYEKDIFSQKLALEQKERNLKRAEEDLEKYFIFAPFDGIIGQVNSDIKTRDNVSPSIPLATLLTKEKIAKISLNEIETVSVKEGQKAILTFDALPDLKLVGRVIEIDTIGTISQGVVSYNVKIILEEDNEMIKPGMSVSAEIVTQMKKDILVLPRQAVKSENDIYYVNLVEVPEEKKEEYLKNPPSKMTIKRQEVSVGISNEKDTEIVSGVKEGDLVVLSSLTLGKNQSSRKTNSSFQIPGFTGGSSGMRMR
jgi:HlyD family secretion protein